MKNKKKKNRKKKTVKKFLSLTNILIVFFVSIFVSAIFISIPGSALSKKASIKFKEFPKINSATKENLIIDRVKKNISQINNEKKINILVAEETNGSKIIIDGEEKIIPSPTEKNITYMQILQNPNDLDLNLKYAQQQGKIGNYKQTIATLERLGMLYPDNVEIRLYLLSVLVQADSPDKALTIIGEIKESEDLTPEDLQTVDEIEEEIKSRKGPKLWNFYADIGIGAVQSNNVNSVSRTNLQSDTDELIPFASPKHDRTYSESLGLTATRSIGEASTFMINLSASDSAQVTETTDDFESYGLTLSFDTLVGNQSLSPYYMLSKTDNKDDATSISMMAGVGGFFSLNDRNAFSYGYSYSDSKNDENSSDTTARDTNSIGHGVTLGHDFTFNEIISSSIGLGYSISEAEVGTNDFETYDFNLRLNFAYPWAYISVGRSLSFNDYMHVDTSINSNRIRSDYTDTYDLMITKALGDIIPFLDRNRSLFINLAYDKVFSEANIINYDYEAESLSLSLSRSFHLNK